MKIVLLRSELLYKLLRGLVVKVSPSMLKVQGSNPSQTNIGFFRLPNPSFASDKVEAL